jgi:hypothetical protein
MYSRYHHAHTLPLFSFCYHLAHTEYDDVGGGDNNTSTDDFDAAGGAGGTGGVEAAELARHTRLLDSVAHLSEFTAEKRSTKREGTLRKVFRALTQFATGESGWIVVSDHSDPIFKACLYGLRVGQPAEQYAACRVLEAASVVLGADQDEWCEQMDRPLRRLIMTTSKAVPVRMAALRAMAMTVFICSSDVSATETVLDLCQEVAATVYRNENTPVALRATGLDCWALLATTLVDFRLAGQDDIQMGRGLEILALLKDCLETTNVDLRSAAGECVALIHETRLNMGIKAEEGENTTARRFRRGSWDGSEWEVLMDEVKQRIAELSVESGYHLSKKAKKQQRATFREFMGTIVDDEAPEEIITFRNGNLTLTNWREIIQLNFVRHCLQGGFQIQLTTNETLQIIFGANGELLNEAGGMSQLEKRLTMSKTSEASKSADIDMGRKRDKRENVKNDFLVHGGDDFL